VRKRKKKPPLNVIGAAVAGLGAPGLILTVAISVAVAGGLSGAAAITAALAAIGGSMIGGVAVLVVGGLLATGITIYGSEAVIKAVIKELKKRGRKKNELLQQVESYWVSRGLKLKVKEYVEDLWA
jgi:hypothetical protein